MISKELLSEVLGEKRVILDYEVSIDETEIHYGHKDIDEDGFINIYELAHKCKEWARDKDIFLRSFYDYEGAFCYISAPTWVDKIEIPKTGFCSETEVEAIIKASEWILNEILHK